MNPLRHVTRLSVAVALFAGLALGCLGRSPAVRQFTLSPVPGSSSAASADRVVFLGPVGFPAYLERSQLVTRVAPSELAFDEYRRWAGGFESNVVRVLADDLGSRLGTTLVVLNPAEAPYPLGFRVAVDFLQFEGEPGQALTLRARWVIREEGGDGVWNEQSTIRRPLADDDVESLVSAHNAALGELADIIAAQIRAAGQPAP